MTKHNKISTLSRETNKPYECKNCYIIRFFLLAVVFIVLLALIQSDKLHYLYFVTPTNAAILVVLVGIIIFLGKLIKYIFEKKKY